MCLFAPIDIHFFLFFSLRFIVVLIYVFMCTQRHQDEPLID